jgi:SAM-dependent methyltransferase
VRIHVGLAGRGEEYDWRHLRETYERFVRPSDTVLEIGASVPARTAVLAEKCYELIGVELYPERVPPATSNIRYVVADWQRLSESIPKDSVDVAVSSHVIEHVPDDIRALNELHDVLRPGGVAIVTTPNRKRLVRAVIERVRGERTFPWWEHVREYTEADLEGLVSRSRFSKSEIVPLALGVHGGPIRCYLTGVPRRMRRWSNFWELHLWK